MTSVEFPWRDNPYPHDEANSPVEDERPLWTSGWVFLATVWVWALVGGSTIIVPIAVLALSSLMSALDSRKPKWRCVMHSVVFCLCVSALAPVAIAAIFL